MRSSLSNRNLSVMTPGQILHRTFAAMALLYALVPLTHLLSGDYHPAVAILLPLSLFWLVIWYQTLNQFQRADHGAPEPIINLVAFGGDRAVKGDATTIVVRVNDES